MLLKFNEPYDNLYHFLDKDMLDHGSKEIGEHEALHDLGKNDKRKLNTDIQVMMADVETHTPKLVKRTTSKTGESDNTRVNMTIRPALEDMLSEEVFDLVRGLKSIDRYSQVCINDISDTKPNKHTEEVLKDLEVKIEKLSTEKN